MVEFTLEACDPLEDMNLRFEALTVQSVTGIAVVSIAIPSHGLDDVAARVRQAYGTSLPEVGHLTISNADDIRFLRLARDQVFVLFKDPGHDPLAPISRQLGGLAYLVDQSDSWVMLSVEGAQARSALERICPLDLDPRIFPEDRIARTVMEHVAVIILRSSYDRFLLLSPRSSAQSFAHAVRVSAENVSDG
ncbi:MAG: sarcosine oxidase subunit gamma [Hyphomicrobiaceae bacterium]